MTDLNALYPYQVVNGQDAKQFDTRRRAAKYVVSLKNKGVPGSQIDCQKRDGKTWVYDQEIWNLATKYASAAAKNGSKAIVEKELTVKVAVRNLMAACKLASAAGEISQAHLDAIIERADLVAEFSGNVPDDTDEVEYATETAEA